MACQCGSIRIIHAGAKCSDRFWASYGNVQHEGYVPGELGIGSGDYLELSYCADCGHIQGFQPILESTLTEVFYPNGKDED
jgi:hypothetical protein